MQTLSASAVMHIWEVGARQHPIDRALTMLSALFPGWSRHDLALLSIGQRDGHLLTLREQLFGTHLLVLATCPVCAERVEFGLQTADIRTPLAPDGQQPVFELVVDAFTIQCRLPNSTDLAAIVHCDTVEQARRLLEQRCVLEVRHGEEVVSEAALPEQWREHLAARLREYDPQAEILFNLQCPACEHSWQMLFDIGAFLWEEIGAQARRLLRDVHTLARCYGWREADILALSQTRRQWYLELARQ
jgi:hypothetical protein